jgi:hypothetical protein
VYEDPATGAFGTYLTEIGATDPTTGITITQGADMGQPSTLVVIGCETNSRRRPKGRADGSIRHAMGPWSSGLEPIENLLNTVPAGRWISEGREESFAWPATMLLDWDDVEWLAVFRAGRAGRRSFLADTRPRTRSNCGHCRARGPRHGWRRR